MRMILVAAALAVGLPSSAVAARLPRSVFPTHYALHITPDFAAGRFAGQAVIEISVQTPVRDVVLHAAGLNIRRAAVRSAGFARAPRAIFAGEDQTIVLRFDAPVETGPATLEFEWDAPFDRELRGFYLGRTPGQGQGGYAATQLQSTEARRMFPSFDEPEMKASFAITVTAADNLTVISNGPEAESRPGPGVGYRTVRFATTPRIPTYLVALVIGDFECLADRHGAVPLRVCAPRGRVRETRFAMDATKAFLSWFERYYGLAYPFAKLDQVALPEFAWGAMENAGAVTYLDEFLLLDERTASLQAKRTVAEFVAHELAHLWFGDLVTMRWWDDVWLNEGFASWMETRPQREWQPDWLTDVQEVANVDWAMAADALPSARAMHAPAETPAEIEAQFDDIAYRKAAAVLRMVEFWVGAETFRAGVAGYLAKNAWGNTAAGDFARALAATSERPVQRVLESFVRQPGVPLVGVDVRHTEDGRTEVSLSQRRFALDPAGAAAPPGEGELWSVPVCLRTEGQARCALLESRAASVTLDGHAEFLHANADGTGYYLTEYSPAALDALRRGFAQLAPTERMALLRDEWWLVRSGRRSIDDYLALAAEVRPARDGALVEQVIKQFAEIERVLLDPAERAAFAAQAAALFAPAAGAFGLVDRPEDDEGRRVMRANVTLGLGLLADDAAALARARAAVDAWLVDPSAADPVLLGAALRVAAAHGDAALHERLAALLGDARRSADRDRVLVALASFRDPALLARTLELARGATIQGQEVTALVDGVAYGSAGGAELAWQFLRDNWRALAGRVPEGHQAALAATTAALCTPAAADEVRQFFAGRPDVIAPGALDQTVEAVNACARFKDAQAAPLARRLHAGAAN